MRRRTSLLLAAAAIASLLTGLSTPATAAPAATAAPGATIASASPTAAMAAPDGSSPVYRFWSPTFRAHFYTMSVDERDHIMATWPDSIWSYEGAKFGAFDTAQPGTVPLYRFWSARYNGHFYTTSETEMLHVRAVYDSFTWGFEGVAFHVYPEDSPVADTRAVARFFSPTFVHHFYTADATEAAFVKANYPAQIWTYENDNFRVPAATPAAAALPLRFGDGYHPIGATLPAGRYRTPGGAACD